jgi:hypothetical protein
MSVFPCNVQIDVSWNTMIATSFQQTANIVFLLLAAEIVAEVPAVPDSVSPDGRLHAVMDIDRDSSINPEWKDGSYPRVEITDKATGRVLASFDYDGGAGDDERPLREHIKVKWRKDSKAFAVNTRDRYYTHYRAYIVKDSSQFVHIPLPSYHEMTSFHMPDTAHLRSRWREIAAGWDSDGLLICDLFAEPMPSFTGSNPLKHRVYMDVSLEKISVVRVEQEEGEWQDGDWLIKKPK